MPRPRLESATWWPDLLELKDELPLRDLAQRFGVSVNGLSRALKRSGIDRRVVRPGRDSSTSGSQSRVDPRSAEAQAWWSEFMVLKDTHSLATLARRFGVAEITLQRALRRTGVQRKSQRGARGNRQTQAAQGRIAQVKHLLGVVPDGEVARQASVSRYAVAQFRKEQGIPSVRDNARRSRPVTPSRRGLFAPMSQATSLSLRKITQGREAYLVRVSTDLADGADPLRFVSVGRDLADAASQAQEAVAQRMAESGGSWNIDGLEFLGPAL